MPSRPQRITNGHRAAICGLVLAGVPLIKSCQIAGAPYLEARKFLPDDWRGRVSRRSKWTPAKLAALRKDYVNPKVPQWQIALRHRTTVQMVQYLARREGWPHKPMGRPKGRGNRKQVAHLVNTGMSRTDALQAVLS